jgi:hypothetical protein
MLWELNGKGRENPFAYTLRCYESSGSTRHNKAFLILLVSQSGRKEYQPLKIERERGIKQEALQVASVQKNSRV